MVDQKSRKINLTEDIDIEHVTIDVQRCLVEKSTLWSTGVVDKDVDLFETYHLDNAILMVLKAYPFKLSKSFVKLNLMWIDIGQVEG